MGDIMEFLTKEKASKWEVHSYSSLAEMLRYLEKNESTKTNQFNSHETNPYRTEWTKSANFEEALEVIRTGNAEIMAGLKKAVKIEVDNLAKELMSEPESYVNDVCGLFFDIAKVIEGEPEAWLREPWDKQKKPRISIPIMGNYGSGFDSNKAIANASKIIALVKALEDAGVEVELTMFFGAEGMSNGGKKRHGATDIMVKNFDESFNWKKLSAMLHPSFFRRVIFRERELLFPKTLSGGYGGTPYPSDWFVGGKGMLEIGDAKSIERFKEATLGMLQGK